MGYIIFGIIFVGLIIPGLVVAWLLESRKQHQRILELYKLESEFGSVDWNIGYRSGVEEALNILQIKIKGVNS